MLPNRDSGIVQQVKRWFYNPDGNVLLESAKLALKIFLSIFFHQSRRDCSVHDIAARANYILPCHNNLSRQNMYDSSIQRVTTTEYNLLEVNFLFSMYVC